MSFDTKFSLSARLGMRLAAVALAAAPVLTASAQRIQTFETRAALTERAEREERAGNKGLAAAIRARLQDGDFQEGDRIIILFENPPPARAGEAAMPIRPDTLMVRSGRVIEFPQARYENVMDMPVGGLLRSELPDSVRAQVAKVFRNPQLRVTSLISLSVTGAVLQGGFVNVPPDIRLNDVFIAAGGLSSDADLRKVEIRRGAIVILSGKDAEDALNSGVTVDGAQLRAGDQINVPAKKPSNWLTYVGLGLSVVTIIVTLMRNSQ
jgi:hypothetical protein